MLGPLPLPGRPIARVHPSRLESPGIRAARNLAIGGLAGHPDLDVMGLGGAETRVAAAQDHQTVWQAEALQGLFRTAGHPVEFGFGIIRRHNRHQLDLVELMLAQHAARVAAGRTGFGPEARRVCRHANGDTGAEKIGHKIRHHLWQQKVPFTCVVGDREAYRAPAGWQAIDPLRADVSYGESFSLIGVDPAEGEATRRALLTDPVTDSQILLVRGPLVEWMPRVVERIRPLDGDDSVRFTEHALRTADGVHLDYLRIERPAAGDLPARRHLLGIVDLGPETLVVDAGGPADRFDFTAVEGFLRSLQLGQRREALPAAPGATR